MMAETEIACVPHRFGPTHEKPATYTLETPFEHQRVEHRSGSMVVPDQAWYDPSNSYLMWIPRGDAALGLQALYSSGPVRLQSPSGLYGWMGPDGRLVWAVDQFMRGLAWVPLFLLEAS